jgi:hypothetical protein
LPAISPASAVIASIISNWQAPAGDIAENHDMTKIGGLSAPANLALVAPQKRQ